MSTVPIRRALDELSHAQVRLAAGPMARQAEKNHRLLLDLDENAMLRPFRVRARHSAPGEDLGGWYDADGFAPGGTFGQWLSALSRNGAITGDQATHDKVHRLVRAYSSTIEMDGRFYQNNRFPAYIYDKLAAGLVDACRLSRDHGALQVLERATQSALPFLPSRAVPRDECCQPGEEFSRHAWDESYTLSENQFLAWHLTQDDQYLILARRFLYDEFFSALAAGDNVLPGKHAYSHVNALSSAAQAYLSLNMPMHLDAVRRGFEMIDLQSYATGGWGPDEHFVAPGSGALGASIAGQKMSFETPCGAYAHAKLTRYLLRITRDARYGDSMERVIYNTALGALPLELDGRAFYYSDYTRSARKAFHPDRWPCCSGTLPLIAADYAICVAFTDANGIYLNLYVGAQVTWRQHGMECGLIVATEYPYEGAVSLTVQLAGSLRFTLFLRIPAWTSAAEIFINGQRHMEPCVPGAFAAIDRVWSSGDRVHLELPMPLRLLSVDAEHPDTVALLAGPLVLMQLLEDTGDRKTALTRTTLLAAEHVAGTACEWRVQASGSALRFRPFMDIGEERYRTYQTVVREPQTREILA
jgi:DUF1680 family protein